MIFLLILSLAGLIDAAYLTWEHINNVLPPCTVNNFLPILSDCGQVLRSAYAEVFGIPLALFGAAHYALLSGVIIYIIIQNNKIAKQWIILQSIAGAIFSLYLMYLQIIVIKSICIYCTLSAFISFTIVTLVFLKLKIERISIRLFIYSFIYKTIIKPILFLFNPEFIHEQMVNTGEIISKTFIANLMKKKLVNKNDVLKQKIAGITFSNPVGLAAGFDYDAKLTQVLSKLDFGYQTIGTITNGSYGGNSPPRLGRLPKSKSLLVNKGFKNKGAENIALKISNFKFQIPLGISIGMTNSKNIKTLNEAIFDIKNAFKIFEKNNVKNSYYELNISCPNLINNRLNFYSSKNLNLLLNELNKLHIKKPIFIKMPIDKTNQEFLSMLKIIINFKFIKGIIIGNLQKDRNDISLNRQEVKKFKKGYFSGKPCEERSNELIKLTYKKYKNQLVIIGCGGIFNGEDAYKKIKLGASLLQLITGMIFEGPQLISQINLELVELLKKDGYNNINRAIGINNQ